MSLVLAGVLSLYSGSDQYSTTVSAQPEACGYIRYQVDQGMNIISTHKHKLMRVNPFDPFLLRHLDGHQNRGDLFDLVLKAIDCGTISMTEPTEKKYSESTPIKQDQQQRVRKAIRAALQKYANEGCLTA